MDTYLDDVRALAPGKTKNELVKAIQKSLIKEGWMSLPIKSEAKKSIENHTDELIRIASLFPVNSIIEKRGNNFHIRDI